MGANEFRCFRFNMVRKQDQEHVKALLTEAITVLCKNGLGFESQLNIEALIGITLDKDEVFLVSINETVNARNTRVSSMIELSCEDVCHRDCPELEPQSPILSRAKIGPASSKRKAQKRKYSSSSNSDKPPELERITDTDSRSPFDKDEPTEKKVQSGNGGKVGEQNKLHSKEMNKYRNDREMNKYGNDREYSEPEQRIKNNKCLHSPKSERRSLKSKSQDSPRKGSPALNEGVDEVSSKARKQQEEHSNHHPNLEHPQLRKVVSFIFLSFFSPTIYEHTNNFGKK